MRVIVRVVGDHVLQPFFDVVTVFSHANFSGEPLVRGYYCPLELYV